MDLKKLFALSSKELSLIRDSKKLSAKQRCKALEILKDITLSSSIAKASVKEVEHHGIVDACFLAMQRSIESLDVPFHMVYIDGNKVIPNLDLKQEAIVKGDNLVYSISAASIHAKQARDSYMQRKASDYPSYSFQDNVGYGSKTHLDALYKYGPCPLHRKNFAPVKNMHTNSTFHQ